MADTALRPVLRTVQFDAVDNKKNAEGSSSSSVLLSFSTSSPRNGRHSTGTDPTLRFSSMQ